MALLDFLTETSVVRVRLFLYSPLLFFSFFIFVGVAVMKDKAGGCPLYVESGHIPPVSNCNYPMAIAIIFQLLYILFRFVFLFLALINKLALDSFMFSNVMEIIYVFIDVAACILTFIGACILSAGMNANFVTFISSISTPLNVAQAGAWISSVLWLLLAFVGVLYILRSGKLPFLRSSEAPTGLNKGPAAGPQNAEAPPNYEPPKY